MTLLEICESRPLKLTSGWIELENPSDELAPSYVAHPGTGGTWQHAPDPAPKVSFHLSKDGEVKFRGSATPGFYGEAVFYLPEGFRPAVRHHFVCPVEDGAINMDSIRFRAEAPKQE